MKITFGMPELLVVFSLVIYSQAFWFSIISFILGILSRVVAATMDQQKEEQRKEALLTAAKNFTSAVITAVATSGVKTGEGFH